MTKTGPGGCGLLPDRLSDVLGVEAGFAGPWGRLAPGPKEGKAGGWTRHHRRMMASGGRGKTREEVSRRDGQKKNREGREWGGDRSQVSKSWSKHVDVDQEN